MREILDDLKFLLRATVQGFELQPVASWNVKQVCLPQLFDLLYYQAYDNRFPFPAVYQICKCHGLAMLEFKDF